jgi:ABC-type polysaccharide/polyol phosphate transport system ATPase subunit
MSQKDEIAIKVSNVSKSFKLPHQKQNSVKSLFVNMFSGRRTYEKQKVLRGINFEVKHGEFFGIVGRNGGGKSTLLKLLAGIYVPDKGSIEINGKLTPFIELGVGFNPELTGKENVYLNGALLGFSKREMNEIYEDIVAFAELERFMDQKLKNYSSGMQVRLAFSVAIQAKTDILLIDEVLAVGDANFQQKCFDIFETFKEEGRTVIFISHSMQMVKRFCDRAVLISEGKIVAEGEPEVVATEYEMLNDNRINKIQNSLTVKDSREAHIVSKITTYISPIERSLLIGSSKKRDKLLLESLGFNVVQINKISELDKSTNLKPTAAIFIDEGVAGPGDVLNIIMKELKAKGSLSSIRRIFVQIKLPQYSKYLNEYAEDQPEISEISNSLLGSSFVMIDGGVAGVDPGCQYSYAVYDRFDDKKKELLWGYLKQRNK